MKIRTSASAIQCKFFAHHSPLKSCTCICTCICTCMSRCRCRVTYLLIYLFALYLSRAAGSISEPGLRVVPARFFGADFVLYERQKEGPAAFPGDGRGAFAAVGGQTLAGPVHLLPVGLTSGVKATARRPRWRLLGRISGGRWTLANAGGLWRWERRRCPAFEKSSKPVGDSFPG